MPKSNFLRKKNKTGATADFKRLKAKVRLGEDPCCPYHTRPAVAPNKWRVWRNGHTPSLVLCCRGCREFPRALAAHHITTWEHPILKVLRSYRRLVG